MTIEQPSYGQDLELYGIGQRVVQNTAGRLRWQNLGERPDTSNAHGS